MNNLRLGVLSAVMTVLAATSVLAADAYGIDKAHSSVGFSIRHMMISKTVGVFDDVDGVILFSPDDLAGSKLDMTIKAISINTRNEQRDKHLRSADFFEADKFPLIVFKSKKIVKSEGDNYTVTGDLTMKGVTRTIDIPVTVLGPVKNPMSGAVGLGFEANFNINRQDYGISWNKVLDNGGLMIANDVAVQVSLETSHNLK
ncbi:MAG: YceI family protein [Candidatus Omnitrophota bacterium]